MIVIRYALSDPAKTELRSALHAAHKEHIRIAPFTIVMSGPAFQPGSDATAAALLIANVEIMAELENFSNADPFVTSGVYSQVWILEWQPSLGKTLGYLSEELGLR